MLLRILFAVILLTACETTPSTRRTEQPPPANWITASSCKDAVCAAAAATYLAIVVAATPVSARDRKAAAESLSGTCVMKMPNYSGPCGSVSLTITDREGRERSAWIEGSTFSVDHLADGPFQVIAENETHTARAQVDGVKAGSTLEIVLKARAQPK